MNKESGQAFVLCYIATAAAIAVCAIMFASVKGCEHSEATTRELAALGMQEVTGSAIVPVGAPSQEPSK